MSDLLQFTGLISAFLLLCGVLKFYIYYKKFGISILRFIEISEILTLFMDNLIAYLSIIIPTSVYIILIILDTPVIDSELLKNYFNILLNKWPIVIGFFSISIVGVIIYRIKNAGLSNFDLILLGILVICCSLIVPFAYLFLSEVVHGNEVFNMFPTGVYMVLMCIILLVYSILAALNEARKVMSENYYSGTKIFFKDRTIMDSTDTIFFIGMTKSYIFVYERSNRKCIAYRIEAISSIEFMQK